MAKAYTKSSVCVRCGRTWIHNKYARVRFCSSACSNKRRGDNFEARFYARIDRSGGSDACWLWVGGRDKNGYGKVRHYSVGDLLAHRVAFELHHGLPLRSPRDVIIRHSCDNPPCCNPAHLLDGTHADNSDDKVQRDRHTKGEDVNTARLTEEQVMEARELYRDGFSVKSLCERFKLSKSAMHYAIKGKSWRHLPLVALILLMAVPAFGQTEGEWKKKLLDNSNGITFTPNGTVITPMSDWRPTSWPATPGPVHIVGVPEGEVLPLTPSKPKFDRTFWIASGLWGAASTADIITTHKALERGAVEQNPIFARRNGHAVRYTANAIASAGIWGVAAYAEHRGHRRVARVLLFTGAAIRIGAAFWNNSRRR